MKKKSFLQKIVSTEAVSMADWLALKPYNQPIHNYDIFYVKQCQAVLHQLNVYEVWIKHYGVNRQQFKELACQLVSYLEDYANDIGIWRAYIDTNQALYGYCLPFYDLSEYDKNYINLEDIAFLIWHYLTKYSEKEFLTDPQHDYIMGMSKEIFDIFENALDDSPAIDFYDKYFTIKEDENFFSFKTKMIWFSTESYLLGLDFKKELQNAKDGMAEMAKKSSKDAAMMPIVLYSFLEKYFYQQRSSYSALNGPEWFAKIATCSEQRKAEIIDLTYWIDGKFYMKEKQKEYFIFEHLLTNVQYKTRIDSFKSNPILKPSETNAFNMHLIRWNGVYMLSGMMFPTEMTPTSIKKYKVERVTTPWILSDKSLEQASVITQKMYDAFINLFGSPLAVFDTDEQLAKAHKDYFDYYRETLQMGSMDSEIFAQKKKKFQELTGKNDDNILDAFTKNKAPNKVSVSMFFIKDVGMYSANGLKEAIRLLKAPALTKDQEASLFVNFANGFIPPVCDYLLSQYSSKNLQYPVNDTVDVVKHLPFFHRMNSPKEFDRSYSTMTVVSTEDID